MGVAARLFYKIGHFSATHTLIVIFAAIVCIGICCIGFSTLVVTVSLYTEQPPKAVGRPWLDHQPSTDLLR